MVVCILFALNCACFPFNNLCNIFFSFKKTQFYNTELHCLQTHSSSLSFFILKMKLLWQTVHYHRQQAQSFPHSMHHEEKRKMLRSWLLWAYSGIDYYRPSWYLDNSEYLIDGYYREHVSNFYQPSLLNVTFYVSHMWNFVFVFIIETLGFFFFFVFKISGVIVLKVFEWVLFLLTTFCKLSIGTFYM